MHDLGVPDKMQPLQGWRKPAFVRLLPAASRLGWPTGHSSARGRCSSYCHFCLAGTNENTCHSTKNKGRWPCGACTGYTKSAWWHIY
eukprot:191443-Chlamydomonas_euryale.AAC.11